MDIGRYLTVRRTRMSATSSNISQTSRKHIPLWASPVDLQAFQALSSHSTPHLGSNKSAKLGNGHGDPVLYKHHHEASTIELFYDLFFVGNLAVFTTMHLHTDARSTKNYLGFFTMLWFTWLNTTLFDVRFTTDSVFNRACKAVHFGVMTAFVFCGPIFDSYNKAEDARAFQSFALALMSSRLVLALQYSVVLLQSWSYKRAILPLALTVAANLAAAAVFLVTHFIHPLGTQSWHTLVVWYSISILEGLAIMLIAIFSRVLSFKDSNLIERVGLLTLIILGEGIIGMIKSVSCVTKGVSSNNAQELGTVISAILLIYLLWMLYFDQIDHERFGPVRQQIWAILHYPLHMAILMTVEGSTALIVWNSTVQGLNFVWSMWPGNRAAPATGFASSNDFISYLNASMWALQNRFKTYSLMDHYDWNLNLTAISDISRTTQFNSPQWNSAVVPIVDQMFDHASVFVFQIHDATMKTMLSVMPTAATAGDDATLQAVYNVFDVVVLFFYIAAGTALLLLALMYWFGKMHKSKSELGEIVGRVVMGFALPIIGLTGTFANKATNGFKFVASNWLVPSVTLAFLIVLAIDNVLLAISNHHAKRRSRWSGAGISPKSNYDDTEGLVDSSYRGVHRIDHAEPSRYDHDPPQYRTPSPNPQARWSQDQKSRSGTPVPQANRVDSMQIPVAMMMEHGFQPSRDGQRDGGYAALGMEDNYGSESEHPTRGRQRDV